MKTDSDIWNEQFELCYSLGKIKPEEAVLNSMNQFAQQQACAFAEWISNSPYEQDSATNMWDSFCNRSIKLTTEQLYEQFVKYR